MKTCKVEVYKIKDNKEDYNCEVCKNPAMFAFRVKEDGVFSCGSKECQKEIDNKIFILLNQKTGKN